MVQRIGYGENAMFIVIILKHVLQIVNCTRYNDISSILYWGQPSGQQGEL